MKKVLNQWYHQIKNLCRDLWSVYVFVIALFVLVVVLRVFYELPIAYLTRDPADLIRFYPITNFPFYIDGIVKLPFYLGALSYLGILLWGATIAVCFFCFSILRKTDRKGPVRLFFLLASGISTLLLLDDLFRLHEIVFPVYLHLHGYTLYAAYIVMIAFLLIRYRTVILNTDYLLLLFALACLGFSMSGDVITDMFFSNISGATLLEDGAKFTGIVSWLLYFARVSRHYVMQLITEKEVSYK